MVWATLFFLKELYMRMLALISVAISLIAISCNSSDPSTTDGNVTAQP